MTVVPQRHRESPKTAVIRNDAVLRSIATMRDRLGEDLPLRTLARAARLSPFHFHRIFQRVTDATPARFLAAWRMAEAKRLLVHSSDSVTDICMRIGYNSLGTFTSQFTRAVGMPPGRFRRAVAACADVSLNATLAGQPDPAPARAQFAVTLTGGPADGTVAVVGLFTSGIPQERPAACAVAAIPTTVELGGLPAGTYHPMAMCFEDSITVADAMTAADSDRCWVAAAPVPVQVGGAAPPGDNPIPVRLTLRRRLPTDPPVVLALPLLMDAARPA